MFHINFKLSAKMMKENEEWMNEWSSFEWNERMNE